MNRETVLSKLTEILAEILVLNPEEIQASSKLVDDLDADSITFLELTYRIRQDFGLEIPEAKVNEEALGLPLTEGIEQLEKAIGGTTLFEFMNAEASRGQAGDELETQMNTLLSTQDPESLSMIKEMAGDAFQDPDACVAVGRALRSMRESPARAEQIDALSAKDPTLGEMLQGMEKIAEQQGVHDGGAGADMFSVWRRLAGTERARERTRSLTVGQLARMMGTDHPEGSQADDPVSALQLRDLFRFITVESYVRYIIYLHDAQGRIKAMGGADAMNEEVTARLRAQQ